MLFRSADRLGAVAAGEAHPLRGEPVEVGRVVVLAAVAAEVVDAQVVGVDQDDVGAVDRGLAGQGRQEQAAASFRRATELLPNHGEAHRRLSQCLRTLGDRDGATQALRVAVRCLPSDAAARAELGELLAGSGRAAEALDHLRCAATLRPDDENIKKLVRQLETQPPAAGQP